MAFKSFTVESVTESAPGVFTITYCDPARPNEHYVCAASAGDLYTVDMALKANEIKRKDAAAAAALLSPAPKTRTATVDV